jgi:hypothetical protein
MRLPQESVLARLDPLKHPTLAGSHPHVNPAKSPWTLPLSA